MFSHKTQKSGHLYGTLLTNDFLALKTLWKIKHVLFGRNSYFFILFSMFSYSKVHGCFKLLSMK